MIKQETNSDQFINLLLQIDNYFKEHNKDYDALKKSRIDNFSQMLSCLADGKLAIDEEALVATLAQDIVNGTTNSNFFCFTIFEILPNKQQDKILLKLTKYLQDNKHDYNTEQRKTIEFFLSIITKNR